LRVLLINKFFYPKGGVEACLFSTGKLLEQHGHEVAFFSMKHPHNLASPYARHFVSQVEFNGGSLRSRLKAASRIFYSFEGRRNLRNLLKEFQPDVAHLNGIAHQLSPSILHELKDAKVPIVMTLHDYKLICPNYMLLAKGRICERCAGGRYYNAIWQNCHKDSLLASTLVAAEMTLHHHILHIYNNVDIFISPSHFLREKVKEMGFQGEITHIPNFVDAEEYEPSFKWDEGSVVYFGRLSKEKGLLTLIGAVREMNVHLKIIGEGPQRRELENKINIEGMRNVHILGYKKGKDLHDQIKRSMFVVLPSDCYENNPCSVIEAFALGKPVIGSRIGGIPELIQNFETGLTFNPGDMTDLREKMSYYFENLEKLIEMGKKARNYVENNFNSEKHYQKLMKVYQIVIEKHKRTNFGVPFRG